MGLSIQEKRTKIEMAQRFLSSQLSKTQFCEKENISKRVLTYWLKRLEEQTCAQTDEGQFLQIDIKESQKPLSPDKPKITCELELPHGVKLRFYGATL